MGPAGAPRRSRTAMIRGLAGLGHGRRRAGVLVLVVVVLVVLAARGGDCLRNVNLSIQPSAVERGKQARLVCDYDLEGENLYSVKWYRGVREIFRYTTSDKGPPRTNVFPLPGVNVDLSLSNATQLMLTNVGLAINGNVSCEVTTDKPRLMMAQSNAYMTVVALPRSPPKLWTHRSKYDLGDRLIANCTAPPSNPAAQLTFQINNRTVPSADTAYQLTSDREQWSALSINMPLSQHHFQAGRLTLQCTASLTGGFALKSEALELGVRPSEPVPERVTSSSCSRRARVALVLALLGVLCAQR